MTVAAFLISVAVDWLALMIVLPVAQRLADFALPGLVERSWKLLAIILASSLTTLVVALAQPLVGTLAGLAVFWIGMVKVFDVDFFGAVIIVLIRWLLGMFVTAALVGLLVSL